MMCFQLGWLILGIIFVAENGQRSVVSGMPVDRFDGSKLCVFNFSAMGAEEERSQIALEVVYRDRSSVLAKSTDCDMEFWRDAIGLGMPPGNKRSLDKLRVQLTRGNPELFKIFVDKETQGWLESNVISIVRIVCPNRKFNCIRFPSNDKGASHVRRSLLSIDSMVTEDGISLKPIFLLFAGVVSLIIAVSLCADCGKTKDDQSIEEARPELLGCQKRASQRTITREEQHTDEKTFLESEDVVVEETAEKIDGDSLEVHNHQPQTTITHYEPPPSSVQSPGPPSSTQPVPPTGTENGHPVATETGLPSNTQPVQANGTQPEAEVSRELKAGSSKKKHGSDSDNEEHKGKFWKRTRSARNSDTSGTARSADKTSDAVFQEEEHKNRQSKKDSKELKTKSGKTKRRTSSTDSEKDQKTTLRDEYTERPRETTPTLERPIRDLPLPPGTSNPTLPARPVPQRQFSAPEGEDNTYEQVEARKTKSMERVKAIRPPEFDTFEEVHESDRKPRLPSLDHDSPDGIDTGTRTSDLYETVDDALTRETGDDLYSEVEKSGNEKANEDVVANKDVIEEDVYSKIGKLKQRNGAENLEPDGDEEESYPENSELYEDVDNAQENSDTHHKYSAVDKEEVLRLMIQDGTNTESSELQRTKSDAVVLRRSENELPKRPNTVHVVRATKGEVTQAEGEAASAAFDYTYAKVDLSKKTRRRLNTEGEETHEEETGDLDIPPPLPPAYVSSQQIQIEMGRTPDLATDNKENLYDEVAQKERTPNLELLAPAEESYRLSSVSDDYELVEVVANPNSPIVRTVEDNYSEVVEREPRPKVGGGRGRPVSMEVCRAPANLTVTVTSSSLPVDGSVENEETSLYEQVESRKERKEPSNLSHGGWV